MNKVTDGGLVHVENSIFMDETLCGLTTMRGTEDAVTCLTCLSMQWAYEKYSGIVSQAIRGKLEQDGFAATLFPRRKVLP